MSVQFIISYIDSRK